jgi:hypothetical protein
MERSRILVTDRAFARSAPRIRLALLGVRRNMKLEAKFSDSHIEASLFREGRTLKDYVLLTEAEYGTSVLILAGRTIGAIMHIEGEERLAAHVEYLRRGHAPEYSSWAALIATHGQPAAAVAIPIKNENGA